LKVALFLGVSVAAVTALFAPAAAQRGRGFQGSAEAPAIQYASRPPSNAIERLNARLDAGAARLTFQGRSGYLRSVLDAIGLRADSQMLVFSDASFQARFINESNPRAIFFKDDVELGWVRDGEVIEVAAQDPGLGTVFYTLQQKANAAPRFKRAMVCLGCHMTGGTLEVPGLVLFTSGPGAGRAFGEVNYMNVSTPMAERFGGWFVTGTELPHEHRGNEVRALAGRSHALTVTTGLYPADGYVASTSDIAALLVFTHQAEIQNLLIRASWEGRTSTDRAVLQSAAADLVESMLFVGEAAIDAPVRGASGFAERFATDGPRDAKGRSLRDLDLRLRLMRHPCSYMIYSPLFDGMPPAMTRLVYERLWNVLSGADTAPRYRRLTVDDRRAIVEILRATRPGLPAYFAGAVK